MTISELTTPLCRAVLAASPLWLAACVTISGEIPPAAPPQPTGSFQAGAAKVDLTPHPGFPMGGHSISGKTARGYWTRLYSRALYFEDDAGRAVALVSCDLWSIPAGLSDRVTELCARTPSTAHLGQGQIIVAATHTHQSPGNFSSSPSYNTAASHREGFDERLFEFLARRIAQSVREACTSKRSARVFLTRTKVGGLARNRSMPAFLRNPEARALVSANANLPPLPPHPLFPDPRSAHGVDPTVSVLRVESTATPPATIALATFVAVHPTAMSHDTEVYSGDLLGVAAILAERQLAGATTEPPVVAIFNGAEGDVSPAWQQQDRLNTVTLGTTLADAIVELADGGAAVHGEIRTRFSFRRLAGRTYPDRAGIQRQVSDDAIPGVATLGGAEDGRTLFHDLGWIEGVTGTRTHDQGSKKPAFDPRFLDSARPRLVAELVEAVAPAPESTPLTVARVGSVLLATLPGECTTVLGRRIAADLARATAPFRISDVLLIGLAGEYLSYFTTPEEYEAQHYEGASTLYGPASGGLIAHDLSALARSTNEPDPPPQARAFCYPAGSGHDFEIEDIGSRPYLDDDGLSNLLQTEPDGDPQRGFPACWWLDSRPELPLRSEPDERVTPQVSLEIRRHDWVPLEIDGHLENDHGLSLITVALSADACSSSSRWAVFWLPPAGLEGEFRFRVDKMNGERCHSQLFRLPVTSPLPCDRVMCPTAGHADAE